MSLVFITWLLFGLIVLLMLPGIGLVFFPVFPAMFYLLVLSLTYGLIDSWQHLSLTIFAILSAIFILSFFVDFLSGLLGAKLFGASKRALIGAIIGGVVGVMLLPPFGALPGIFLGVFTIELLQLKNHKESLKAAGGAVLGAMSGMMINFCLAITFVLVFVVSVLINIL